MQLLAWRVVALAVTLAISPLAVAAQSIQDSVIAQLREQGFDEFSVSRTLLGRIHIIAISETLRREIVINPSTGEILRDYWVELNGGAARAPIIANPGDDDDDDDDDSAGGGTGGGGSGGGTGGGGTGGGTGGGDDDDDDDDGDDDGDDDDDDDDDG